MALQATASDKNVHVHQGLFPYLQYDAGGLIVIYHLVNDWLEEVFVTFREKNKFVMALEKRTSEHLGKGEGQGPPAYFGHRYHLVEAR